jgi:hypothetical protein
MVEPEGGGHCRRPRIRRRQTGDRVGDPRRRRPAAGGQNLGIQSSAGNKDRRFGVNIVRLLAEEHDRRSGGTSAIRCALRGPADRCRTSSDVAVHREILGDLKPNSVICTGDESNGVFIHCNFLTRARRRRARPIAWLTSERLVLDDNAAVTALFNQLIV